MGRKRASAKCVCHLPLCDLERQRARLMAFDGEQVKGRPKINSERERIRARAQKRRLCIVNNYAPLAVSTWAE